MNPTPLHSPPNAAADGNRNTYYAPTASANGHKNAYYPATAAANGHNNTYFAPTNVNNAVYFTPYTAANGYSPYNRRVPYTKPLIIPSGHASFRVICHASRVGGVIGKSGCIVKQLQAETSAKIRVEDAPPGAGDDRVITVIGSRNVDRRLSVNGEEFEVSAAQEALVRVFERILSVAAESDGGESGIEAGAIVSCRMLVSKGRAGVVIGKGGNVVEKLRQEYGCKIRVVNDRYSVSADEMIEIEADILAIKKALVAVSRRLQDIPPLDKTRMGLGRPYDPVPKENLSSVHICPPPSGNYAVQPLPDRSTYHTMRGSYISDVDVAPSMDLGTTQQEVIFRILSSCDRVGGLIGRGGTIVRALQIETGAHITVAAPVSECEERVITVTAVESLESRHSPAQNALVLVFNRLIEAGFEKGLDQPSNRVVFARLVISSNQVGCLMGKGGSIISDTRKITGTGIKIIGGPKCISEEDKVVQITGEFGNVQDALYNVTGRLRNNMLPRRMMNGHGMKVGYNEPETDSPSLEQNSSAHDSFDPNTSLAQNMNNLRLSDNNNHPPSAIHGSSQIVDGLNTNGGQDVARGSVSPTTKGGLKLGSGSLSAVLTNTTVEIALPQNVIGAVYGENGSNLNRLRKISGAKVVLHEPRPGTTDPFLIISGSPDETQAAQSLLQAFLIDES